MPYPRQRFDRREPDRNPISRQSAGDDVHQLVRKRGEGGKGGVTGAGLRREPEQRLDTGKRELVAEIVAARRDAGTTVVLACHDPLVIERVADRVVDLVGATD